jgi:hypothetical protein
MFVFLLGNNPSVMTFGKKYLFGLRDPISALPETVLPNFAYTRNKFRCVEIEMDLSRW